MEKIEAIDRWLLLLINSFHTPFLDEVMWLISAKLTWIPLYVLLIYLFSRTNNLKRTLFFVLSAGLVVLLTDQISVHLFKEVFERYRPSHHELLTNELHFYRFNDGSFYKGGMYGFVSSHAANFFGVLTFATLVLENNFKRIGWYLFAIAFIVCISRVYLGVHYVSDILFGSLLGITIAVLIHKFFFIPIIEKEFLSK